MCPQKTINRKTYYCCLSIHFLVKNFTRVNYNLLESKQNLQFLDTQHDLHYLSQTNSHLRRINCIQPTNAGRALLSPIFVKIWICY